MRVSQPSYSTVVSARPTLAVATANTSSFGSTLRGTENEPIARPFALAVTSIVVGATAIRKTKDEKTNPIINLNFRKLRGAGMLVGAAFTPDASPCSTVDEREAWPLPASALTAARRARSSGVPEASMVTRTMARVRPW
eukprot:COSAG05_NODE_414_length_10051_cov_120.012158_11_plen_139_part_00